MTRSATPFSLATIIRFTAALAAVPLLTGAKGGCSAGGEIPVGEEPDADPSVCQLSDCAGLGSTLEAKLCADGTAVGRTVCATDSAGKCFWDFPACPAVTACSAADCAGQAADNDAKVCADGTAVGRTQCTRSNTGKCQWDFPACPAPTAACTAADCAGQGATGEAKICPDGTGVGRTQCSRSNTGKCQWDFPACPTAQVDAGAPVCSRAACANVPVKDDARVCADSSVLVRSVCAATPNGCDWDFPACPAAPMDAGAATCSRAACANVPVKEDLRVCADGTVMVRTVCASTPNGCDWDFPACPLPAAADAGSGVSSDAASCGCVPPMQWGWNGGFIANGDTSRIASCYDYSRTRTNTVDGVSASCQLKIPGCPSGVIGGDAIVRILERADVQEAIKLKNVVYNNDTRPIDGSVFRIEVGGSIIDVGSPCSGAVSCPNPAPDGVRMLADQLKALDAQHAVACAQQFPNF